VAAWTGRHLLHADAAGTWLFDPSTDRWTAMPGITPFAFSSGVSGAYAHHFAATPASGTVFVWGAYASSPAPGNASAIFDDSGTTPRWISVPASGAPAAGSNVSVTTDGTNFFVLWGIGGFPNAARLNRATMSWTPIGSTGLVGCANGAHGFAPFAWVNGLLTTFGGLTTGDSGCMGETANKLDPVTLSWSSASVDAIPFRWAHTLLAAGNSAFVFGGTQGSGPGTGCLPNAAYLYDPRGSATMVALPPAPAGPPSKAFAMYTGHSIILWGGGELTCMGFPGTVYGTGSIGVVNGNSVAWSALPAAGRPSPRTVAWLANEDYQGDTQFLWTGGEALIYSGYDTAGTPLLGGNRYQPPVGCVCPRDATAPASIVDACSGVTLPTPAPTCAPL
jgi:hypothetical protein